MEEKAIVVLTVLAIVFLVAFSILQPSQSNFEITARAAGGSNSTYCGDGNCNGAETCRSCSSDCGCCSNGHSCSSNGQCCSNHCCDGTCESSSCGGGGLCGNGHCNIVLGENCNNCPEDCGGPCCGQGGCQPILWGETCHNCPEDCGDCCGNGQIDPGETCCTCEQDVGQCTAVCGNGVCDQGTYGCESCPSNCPCDCCDCDHDGNCEASRCENSMNCDDCQTNCGNGQCEPGETINNCPEDCTWDCGNGVCESTKGEDCDSCPEDCCPTGCDNSCGNGICEASDCDENCFNCPADCSCGSGQKCCSDTTEGDGECCPMSDSCCDGHCCPSGVCCNRVCCSSGEECCAGQCEEPPQGQTCCGNNWCEPENCINDQCCPEAQTCGEDCCEGDATCCLVGSLNFCCPTETACGEIEGQCVPLEDCGNDVCEEGETCSNCGTDCSCPPGKDCKNGECIVHCGDGDCDRILFGEDCVNCEEDCGCDENYTCNIETGNCELEDKCGNFYCDPGEEETCPGDCIDSCGGNGCQPENGEDCLSCPSDCGCCPTGHDCGSNGDCCSVSCIEGVCQAPPESCGNNVCEPDKEENCQTCSTDCGICCGNGNCETGIGENCTTCSEDCGTCCGDGNCEASLGENCATCSQDCGACCGNGMCDASLGENCQNCPADCGDCDDTPGGTCGNGDCDEEYGETCHNCMVDCGPCGDQQPPLQSEWIPPVGSMVLPAFDLSLTLDEPGRCRWCQYDYGYEQCGHNCIGEGTTSILCNIQGLNLGDTKVFIACMDLYFNKDTEDTNTELAYYVVNGLDEINYTEEEVLASGDGWVTFNGTTDDLKNQSKEAEEQEVEPGMVVNISNLPSDKEEYPEMAGFFGLGEYIPRPIHDVFTGISNLLPEPIKESSTLVFYSIILIAFLVAVALLFYIPQRGQQVAFQVLSQREKQTSDMKVKELKKEKVEVKRKIAEIRRRELAGLSAEEAAKKKAYTEQLHNIEDELLKKDVYLADLNARVEKAIEEVNHGTKSSVILQELFKEGYTKKEIEIIKKAFQRRKLKSN